MHESGLCRSNKSTEFKHDLSWSWCSLFRRQDSRGARARKQGIKTVSHQTRASFVLPFRHALKAGTAGALEQLRGTEPNEASRPVHSLKLRVVCEHRQTLPSYVPHAEDHRLKIRGVRAWQGGFWAARRTARPGRHTHIYEMFISIRDAFES